MLLIRGGTCIEMNKLRYLQRFLASSTDQDRETSLNLPTWKHFNTLSVVTLRVSYLRLFVQ